MEKKTLKLQNGETLAYQSFNESKKDTLVLLHGNMSSGVHFEPLIEKLTDFHLIVPDLRGFGDSTYHKPIETLEDFVDDLKMFTDALSIDKMHLAGWSTGGGVALKFAAKYPQNTNKVILIESASHRGYPIPKKDENAQPIQGEFYYDKDAMAKDPVQVAPVVQALKDGNSALMQMIWEQTIYNVKKPSEEAMKRYIGETMKQRNLVDVDWALVTFNMSSTPNGVKEGDGTIEDIKAEVLAIHGDKDLVIPKPMFDELTDALPNVLVEEFENASHSPITDIPDKLAHSIKTFLNG